MQHPFAGVVAPDAECSPKATPGARRTFLGFLASLFAFFGFTSIAQAFIARPKGPPTQTFHEGGGTTYAYGEEGGASTYALGEEGGSTRARGEEGGSSTRAYGEEGAGSTRAYGEEGGQGSTRALYEEGGRITTRSRYEEGR